MAVLLALMVIIDIVLVTLETKDFPTLSFVVKNLRHRLSGLLSLWVISNQDFLQQKSW